jgi:peptidyl-prolyl cis-trans isomerase C
VKDLAVGLVIILLVVGVCFGLSTMRPERQPLPSHPFSVAVGTQSVTNEKVVMRINGEPITESEFNALVKTAPENMRGFYGTPAGRRSLAEQIVKLKSLQQEGERLGANQDIDVTSQLDIDKANVMAQYALRKLVGTPSDAEIRSEYERSKDAFATLPLSHILVAYQGGTVPPRTGSPLSREAAMQKARQIVARLRAGQNFQQTAAAVSDDVESAQRGGDIGSVSPEMLPPELAQVITTLKPGEVSDPVVSRFGIHILTVAAPQVQPIERVHDQIAQKIQTDKVNAALKRLQSSAKVDLDPKFFGATKLEPSQSPRRPS